MAPLLCKGDWAVMSPCSIQECQLGDVVVLRIGSTLLTHRLIQRASGKILTKGDSNLQADVLQPSNEVLGKIRFIRHGTTTHDLRASGKLNIRGFVALLSRCEAALFPSQRVSEPGSRAGVWRRALFFPIRAAIVGGSAVELWITTRRIIEDEWKDYV